MLQKLFTSVNEHTNAHRSSESTHEDGEDEGVAVVREVLQTSAFWGYWKASKTYRFTVQVHEAVIEQDHKAHAAHGPDVYCVAYLSRDRNGTKQKTKLQRRTFKPWWHQSLTWSGVDYLEHFTLEMKTPNLLMSENPCLGSAQFTVAEVAAMSDDEMRLKEFEVVSEKPDFRAKITLGFRFDPRIPGDMLNEIPFYDGEDLFEHIPLYYTIGHGSMCVALYTDSQRHLDELDYRLLYDADLDADEFEESDQEEVVPTRA